MKAIEKIRLEASWPVLAATPLLLLLSFGSTSRAQTVAPDHRAPPLILSTTAFVDGGVIPNKYTQASPNPVSPALSWRDTPPGTQSFTLILHDPDGAPNKGSADVLHWMIFNIPGTARSLPEGVPTTATLPDGAIQARNVHGTPGFTGLGARNVYHHYTIELYALDAKLDLGPDATRAQVMAAMNGHVIGKSAIEGRFHR